MILPSLERGGYSHRRQVNLGQRLGLGSHRVDVVAEKDGRRMLISLKWQQSKGTIEQKIPFEVICLAEALQAGYDRAYLVLGGEGMRTDLRQFYVRGGLRPFLNVPWERIEL